MSAYKNKFLAVLLLAFVLLPFGAFQGQAASKDKVVWTKDAVHERLGFSVKHMTISYIEGHFKDYTATIVASAPDFSDAAIEVVAKVASIDTAVPSRDDHLRSPDFFDVAKYPTMTFKSTSVKPIGDNFAKVFGHLTIRDVTKVVELDAVFLGTVPNEMTKTRSMGVRLLGTIKRSDFNIAPTFPDTNVGDLVQINVNMEFISDK